MSDVVTGSFTLAAALLAPLMAAKIGRSADDRRSVSDAAVQRRAAVDEFLRQAGIAGALAARLTSRADATLKADARDALVRLVALSPITGLDLPPDAFREMQDYALALGQLMRTALESDNTPDYTAVHEAERRCVDAARSALAPADRARTKKKIN